MITNLVNPIVKLVRFELIIQETNRIREAIQIEQIDIIVSHLG